MDVFWNWAGGAALIGLAWLLKTIYRRHQEGKPPLLDPENKLPVVDVPRDAVMALIEEWFKQNRTDIAKVAEDHKASLAAIVDDRLTNHANQVASDLEAHKLEMANDLSHQAEQHKALADDLQAHKAAADIKASAQDAAISYIDNTVAALLTAPKPGPCPEPKRKR